MPTLTFTLLLAAQLVVSVPVTPTPQDWQTINQLITPDHAPLRGWTHLVIGAGMVAQMADVSTTAWAMGQGGFREANPIMRPFADSPMQLGLAKGIAAVGLNYALLKMHEKQPKTALALGIVQVVVIGYVAHRNAQTLGLRD